MKRAICGVDNCGGTTFLKGAGLTAVALLAFQLAAAFPARQSASSAASWRQKDYSIWFQSHQLFDCGPEELTESQLQYVRRWNSCLWIVAETETSGIQSLTDEECRFVVDVLTERDPNLAEHQAYRQIYEACRERLASGSGSPT